MPRTTLLLEPLLLGLLVRPSWPGALVALACVFAFLARTRSRWVAIACALGAIIALAFAISLAGWTLIVPLGLVAPLAITRILHDAYDRGDELIAELAGAAAMSSSASAIALAGGSRLLFAFALSGIIVARAIPSIVYVRALRGDGPAWPPLALHALAILFTALFAPPLAVAAMAVLFVRAAIFLTRPVKSIAWSEVVFGLTTVALSAAGYRL